MKKILLNILSIAIIGCKNPKDDVVYWQMVPSNLLLIMI